MRQGSGARPRPIEMPGAGTYLGLVALDKKPRTIDAVRVSLDGATEVAIYDLALLTFG